MYYLIIIITLILFRLFFVYKINLNISAFIFSVLLTTLTFLFWIDYFIIAFEFNFLEHKTFCFFAFLPIFLFNFFMTRLGFKENAL
jgi:hypothetical protein